METTPGGQGGPAQPAGPAAITGQTDTLDRLVAADPPLAALHRQCGGEPGGTLAVPALLALVRKARGRRLRLARAITALDSGQTVRAWAEVEPAGEGVQITLSHWRLAPGPALAPADPAEADQRDLLRQMAGATALLDARQIVRFVAVRDPALGCLEAAVAAHPEEPWTSYVTVADGQHHLPLHWRLMDGAQVRIEGAHGGSAPWLARLAPRPGGGFELFLLPVTLDELPPEPAPALPEAPLADPDGPVRTPIATLVARELGPALRRPIDRIIANAESIRTRLAGPLDEAYAGYAADIAEAARHLQGLVEDLADLEAVEDPTFQPVPDRIDLADCAARAAGLLGVKAGRRDITLELPPRDQPVAATGEFRRVLQILLNLVGNAIAYSPEGSTVRLACGAERGGAWIAVADEGPGLTAEQAARVFEKFERLGRSNDGGSGLGLYIARRLARAMGGDLTVAPAPRQGARFVLRLPAG